MSKKKILTLEEAEEIFSERREVLYLVTESEGLSASLFDSDDLYVTKERWLQIRSQVDAFFTYIESEGYIGDSTVEEINRVRAQRIYARLLRKVGS